MLVTLGTVFVESDSMALQSFVRSACCVRAHPSIFMWPNVPEDAVGRFEKRPSVHALTEKKRHTPYSGIVQQLHIGRVYPSTVYMIIFISVGFVGSR